MNHLKLFEGYTKQQYTDAFNHIRKLVDSGESKDNILKYIDTFTGDDIKNLNEIRVIMDRVVRYFNNYSTYLYYNKGTTNTLKKRAGSDWHGDWKAGDIVSRNKYDLSRYYILRKDKIEEAISVLNTNKKYYDDLISNTNLDVKSLKFFCDRVFKILFWCLSVNTERANIKNGNETEDRKKSIIDDFHDLDMENEYDEVNICKDRINRAIDNLLKSV